MQQIADISIIIPTRGRPEHLGRLLDSLSRQSVRAREVIVVENGKKKESQGAVDRFYGILPLRHLFESCGGVSASRNKGIAVSSAPIIAFLDDDCVVDPDWTEVICNTFREKQDLYVLQGYTNHMSLNKSLYAEIFEAENKIQPGFRFI